MGEEHKSLTILRLIIYVACMAACFLLLLRGSSPYILPIFLFLIISRTLMVALVIGKKK